MRSVAAEERVPRHVHRVAARRRLAPQALRQRADMMGTCPAAHAQVMDAERVRLAAKIEDLLARAHERIEPHREGARPVAARIGERHERGLSRRRAVGDRQRRHVTFHRRADLAHHRHDRRRSAVAVQPHDVRAGLLEPPAGLGGGQALARDVLAVHRHRDHRGHFRVLADGLERQQRLGDPRERLRDEKIDPRFLGPAHLLGEDALDFLVGGPVCRIVDIGVAQIAGEQCAGLAGDRAGDAERCAVHGHQVLLPADDAQLLAVHVVGQRLGDIGAGVHEVHVQLFNHLRVLEEHLGHEGTRLQVAAPLELEQVAFRADHRPLGQAREQVAFGALRLRRPPLAHRNPRRGSPGGLGFRPGLRPGSGLGFRPARHAGLSG